MFWLENQEVNTIVDFNKMIATKYEVSADKKCVKINNEVIEYYSTTEYRCMQVIYEKIDKVKEQDYRKTIAEMKPNKSAVTHNIFLI